MSLEREVIILNSLINHKEFSSSALPFLKEDYFSDDVERASFIVIRDYYSKYECMPNKASFSLELSNAKKWKPEDNERINAMSENLYDISVCSGLSKEWLIETTEKFCREKAVYQVILKSIDIYEGNETKIPPGAIPDLMREAVNITFDSSIGHNWLEDAEKRYEFYHNPESAIPFDIEILNYITGGRGVTRKSLNLVMAGVNCGKTAFLCQLACSYARQGYDVVYFSMEMREELISKRIDANIFDTNLNDIDKLSKDMFMGKINEIRTKHYGNIIVKEYPNGTAHVGHFAHVLQELKNKKNIKPAVIIVDYIGITASSRVSSSNTNSYTYQKAVSEELRALAVKEDAIVWSATQLNRSGFDSADVEMTDIADSFGISATADMILSLMRTEALDEVSQVLMKQIKNRYANKNDKLRFTLGVDQAKQQFYDVDENINNSAQKSGVTTARVLGNNSGNKLERHVDKFSGIS